MSDRPYTAAEVDAAVDALRSPERLAHAQEIVAHAAPSLQRVVSDALLGGGWFGPAHESAVARVSAVDDARAREAEVRALVAEETRLSMMVGVAVGFELSRELRARSLSTQLRATPEASPAAPDDPAPQSDPANAGKQSLSSQEEDT